MLYHNKIGRDGALQPGKRSTVFFCYRPCICSTGGTADAPPRNALSAPLPMPTTSRESHSDTVGAQLDVAESLCAQRGRRLTPIRRKVLELLLRHGRSLKAYELLDSMRAVHPGSAPPTVYRALDFLMAEGLVHRLDAVNAWIACHDAGGVPHDLLVVCTGCGAVAEVSDPAMSRQLAERVARTGFALNAQEMEIRALCPLCQKKRPTDPAQGASHGHDHGPHAHTPHTH